MKTRNMLMKYGSTALAAMVATASQAAINTTASEALITGSDVAIYAIGTAVFGVLVAIATVKWVRRAL